MPPKKSKSVRSHRSTLSLQKTEIVINVYDLLPPGRLASILWAVGTSLLHSGVVINGREYAYGGHDRGGLTGVYWTKPRTDPPGGTFKTEILQGFTVAPQAEIDAVIREASDEFQGTQYNLLTKNCNHFTAYLCEKLTGRSGPSWLNRAANIGVALPCVVPREWVEPPEYGTADGELLDEEDEHADEGSRMLRSSSERPRFVGHDDSDGGDGDGDGDGDGSEGSGWDSAEQQRRRGGNGKGKGKVPTSWDRDEEGRQLPGAERVPSARR